MTHSFPTRCSSELIPDDLPGAGTGHAGALDGEEALLGADSAVPFACGAGNRCGAAFRPGAAACVAADGGRDLDRGLTTLERLVERDRPVVAQIGAALDALRPAAAAPLAEHLVEDVGETGAEAEVEPAARAPPIGHGPAHNPVPDAGASGHTPG